MQLWHCGLCRSVISIFISELQDFKFLWCYNFKEVEYPTPYSLSPWRKEEEILLIFDLRDAKSVQESEYLLNDLCVTSKIRLNVSQFWLRKIPGHSYLWKSGGRASWFFLFVFANNIRIMRMFPSSELHKTLAEIMLFPWKMWICLSSVYRLQGWHSFQFCSSVTQSWDSYHARSRCLCCLKDWRFWFTHLFQCMYNSKTRNSVLSFMPF